MILPSLLDPSAQWRDHRLPRVLDDAINPFPVSSQITAQCVGTRCLYDVIQTYGKRVDYDDDTAKETGAVGYIETAITGTCVRCGTIWRMEGTELDKSIGGSPRISPVPLQSGCLLAQEVAQLYLSNSGQGQTYAVHAEIDNDGTVALTGRIGWMGLSMTQRGKYYCAGRLDHWEEERNVQGADALRCLRALAREFKADCDAGKPFPMGSG